MRLASQTPRATQATLVVLAGAVTPQRLQRKVSGYRKLPNVIGFSVQSTPQKTIQELAAAGGFFDPLLSVTTVGELQKAGQSAGVNIKVISAPGRALPQHCPHPTSALQPCGPSVEQCLSADAESVSTAAGTAIRKWLS